MLVLPMMLWAQGQGVQLGLHGGAGQWHSDRAAGSWVPEMGLDARYIVRWRVRPYTQLGLHTGLEASYFTSKLSGDFSNQYTRTDYLGNKIEYTTSATVAEQHTNIGLTIPVLFAFQTHGFALNIGPKLLWVAYSNYQRTVSKASIDAYYPAYGVHVTDQPSTGQIATPLTLSGQGSAKNLQVLLSAELGYEWQIGDPYERFNEHYIGIQLYANYGLWSLQTSADEAMVSVSPIVTPSANPQIQIGSIQGMGSPLSYMSCGLRIYYTIQTVDYSSRGWHRFHGK